MPGTGAQPPVVLKMTVRTGKILAHPALVFVGLISYPLYLWHWPLLAYARILEGGEPPAAVRIALLAASVVLAWLTYELVEKKIRHAKRPAMARIAVPALAATMAAVGLSGVLALQSHLAPRSASLPLIREISRASLDWEYGRSSRAPEPRCCGRESRATTSAC
jgi:peptidoglycan/LPS O-acetylase OafA/YrhL